MSKTAFYILLLVCTTMNTCLFADVKNRGEEQALIVNLRWSPQDDVRRIHQLEEKLAAAIAQSSAGEFDGDEFGKDTCTLYMYGPSAQRLFEVTIRLLRDFHASAGSYLLKRFGKPGARQERVELSSSK